MEAQTFLASTFLIQTNSIFVYDSVAILIWRVYKVGLHSTNLSSTNKNPICLSSLSNLKEANSCHIAGALKKCAQLEEVIVEQIASLMGVHYDFSRLRKALRIVKDGQIFFSEEYTRMKKRNGYTVKLADGTYGIVKYYLVDLPSSTVLVVHTQLETDGAYFLQNAGHHLICIKCIGYVCTILHVKYFYNI